MEKFQLKIFDIFAQKIRKIGIPCIPQFYYIKVGYKGVFISRTYFPDDYRNLHQSNCTIYMYVAPRNKGSSPLYMYERMYCFTSDKQIAFDAFK